MNKKAFFLTGAVIAICFLYTGSAYMSQFFRLTSFYEDRTVDLITSGWNYLLHALGIALAVLGRRKRPSLFAGRRLFTALLASGFLCAALFMRSSSGRVIVWSGYVFHLHVGFYFGYYLMLLAQYVPAARTGICYAAAYAFGSAGTTLLSLPAEGAFFVSPSILWVYLSLAVLTAIPVFLLNPKAPADLEERRPPEKIPMAALLSVVAIMTVCSGIGSGLYASLPQAEGVNWNCVRFFYAPGLILAGLLADRNRRLGTIFTIASLVYPLIATALLREGVTGSVTMSLSYLFRGFLSVYCIVTFTDLAALHPRCLPFAPLGLMVSRIAEGILSLVLILFEIPPLHQMIVSAACVLPVLLLCARITPPHPEDEGLSMEQQFVRFCGHYALTSRESEILRLLEQNLSYKEIAERLFIAPSTVRFHVSNLLKKTGCESSTDVSRAMRQFRG